MNRNELTLEEFGTCLHNSLYLHYMFVCMFDIYVVIKKNHLDLHWTFESYVQYSNRTWYLDREIDETKLFLHTDAVPQAVKWTHFQHIWRDRDQQSSQQCS